MGMKMHLADAGTYSCHSLPVDLHGTILLCMCSAICGAKITHEKGIHVNKIPPVRRVRYIDMGCTF